MSESQLASYRANEFFEFLSTVGERPYRALVEHHIKRTSAKELQLAVLGESQLLPQLQPFIPSYIDATNSRFGYDQEFWKNATCRQAFEAIIIIAAEVLPLHDVIVSVEDAMKPENHMLAFQLFQIPTLNFAYSASTRRAQRKFMGIRKGILG